MLRVERSGAGLTLVSRLGRPRAVAVLAVALALAALGTVRLAPAAAAALLSAATLVAVLGGRAVRARFERGRVRVRPAVPLRREDERPIGEFAAVRIETVGEARRRKADRLAGQYRARAGGEMPSWLLRPSDAPGANDHLRRLVLVAPSGDRLAVTAWLAEDDLEAARAEVDALLR
jgi:hypothetical protein